MKDKIFQGTEVKYLVEITASGFSMHDDDFNITLRRGNKERTFQKNELIEEMVIVEGQEKYNYYLCFDTAEFGTGVIVCIVRAFVPDTDFPDGLRTEVDKFDLLISNPV